MLIEKFKWSYRAYRHGYRLERQEIRLLPDDPGPGESALDVCAHKGVYTYWMGRATGAGGWVYAFEPQPQLASRLLILRADLAPLAEFHPDPHQPENRGRNYVNNFLIRSTGRAEA